MTSTIIDKSGCIPTAMTLQTHSVFKCFLYEDGYIAPCPIICTSCSPCISLPRTHLSLLKFLMYDVLTVRCCVSWVQTQRHAVIKLVTVNNMTKQTFSILYFFELRKILSASCSLRATNAFPTQLLSYNDRA